MIIVNFNQIADVPPQSVQGIVLSKVLENCTKLIESTDYDDLSTTLNKWEFDLFLESAQPDQDWYTRAIVCICLRGLRGECLPNILNISEE